MEGLLVDDSIDSVRPLMCAVPWPLLRFVAQADPVTGAKLKAAAGLAYLDNRRYKLAAKAFAEVSPELGTNYSDVSIAVCSYVGTLSHCSQSDKQDHETYFWCLLSHQQRQQCDLARTLLWLRKSLSSCLLCFQSF